MDKLFIVANFKSYKSEKEAKNWLEEFSKYKNDLQKLEDKEVVICPPFTLLLSFFSAFTGTNINLGAQNVSPFDEGAYTGEVNAKQIKDFAQYVIIGHSERRNYFKESDSMLSDKIKMALKYGLKPIFCVQEEEASVPEGVKVIAYEPLFAIGSGRADTPENAERVSENFLNKNNNYSVLYGGSLTSDNVLSFTKQKNIKGVLVGGASLDPVEFIRIIQNA